MLQIALNIETADMQKLRQFVELTQHVDADHRPYWPDTSPQLLHAQPPAERGNTMTRNTTPPEWQQYRPKSNQDYDEGFWAAMGVSTLLASAVHDMTNLTPAQAELITAAWNNAHMLPAAILEDLESRQAYLEESRK